ncbi:MAG: FAD binding domain-containing protein [Anaerolineae bacterium]
MRNLIEICRPETIDEALTLLARSSPRTTVLAGGTELVGQADPSVEAVVDLSRLGLDAIRLDDGALRIGATATLERIAGDEAVRTVAAGALARAAHAATSSLLRRQATLGGSVVTGQAGELLALLLALGAEAVVYAPQRALRPLAEVCQQPPDSPWLLTEVVIPRRSRIGVSAHCVRRTPSDAPLVAVAAALTLTNEAVEYVGTGLAGVGLAPARLTAAETALTGRPLNNRMIEAAVEAAMAGAPALADHRASAEYRAHMIGVLLRRALAESWRMALDPS